MIEYFNAIIGKNTTPYAKVASGITSLIIIGLLYFNTFPSWTFYLFLFLGFHLIGQISSAILESRKWACHRCGKPIKIIGYKFEKHKCQRQIQ